MHSFSLRDCFSVKNMIKLWMFPTFPSLLFEKVAIKDSLRECYGNFVPNESSSDLQM